LHVLLHIHLLLLLHQLEVFLEERKQRIDRSAILQSQTAQSRSQTLLDVVFVVVTTASALVGLLARVDPLAVDVDGLGERVGAGGVRLLADAAHGLGEPVLEVDGALHAARVVAERAVERRVQLRLRQQLGRPRLALPHHGRRRRR
jgi:hypothetical protein